MTGQPLPNRIASLAAVAVTAIVIAGGPGCGSTAQVVEPDQAFALAVEAGAADDHETSMRMAHTYLRVSALEDIRRDRALRLMAVGAEELGLSYAASLWYLEIASGGRDVELMPQAIAGLERIVMGGPHDDETLVGGYLASAEIPAMPPSIQPFIDYEQGLDSIRNSLDDWGDSRFARIPRSSPYYFRARYVHAVRQVEQGKIDEARAAFEGLLAEEALPDDVRLDAHHSLARLHFESGEYKAALEQFELIRELAPGDPSLLLEMAWAHYYDGDARRALGLLLALDAPVYEELIAPERYLLEAMCLRRLCQFDPARQAAMRLNRRHGAALQDIHNQVRLMDSETLKAAARERGHAKEVASFRRRLQAERARIDVLEETLGEELSADLRALYARGIEGARRHEEEVLATEVEKVAEELLYAEEGVRLIVHELSVALLRGRRRPGGPSEAAPPRVETGDKRVVFAFEGEFWTDELDDLVVGLEDRCIE